MYNVQRSDEETIHSGQKKSYKMYSLLETFLEEVLESSIGFSRINIHFIAVIEEIVVIFEHGHLTH